MEKPITELADNPHYCEAANLFRRRKVCVALHRPSRDERSGMVLTQRCSSQFTDDCQEGCLLAPSH
eukprot:5376009-Amphidinium_carterae.1